MEDEIHFLIWSRDPRDIFNPLPLECIHLSNKYLMDCLIDYWNILQQREEKRNEILSLDRAWKTLSIISFDRYLDD